MDTLKLCESDYRFMSVIWDHEPLASGQLARLCAERLGWKKTTTYTTLKKLCDKGYAENQATIVRALIPREAVQASASQRFIEQTFAGSLPQFLVSFLGDKTISPQEAAELKALIEQHQEG